MPVMTQPTPQPSRPRTTSRRIRRVVWMLSAFTVLLLIGAIVTWRIRKDNTPEEYVPGEDSKDITSALSRPSNPNSVASQANTGVSESAAPLPAQSGTNRSGATQAPDRLLDPGQPLPKGALLRDSQM